MAGDGSTMRAVVRSGDGGPEVLALGTLPKPVPGPHQLLVRVVYAGMNRADCIQRKGRYPPPPGSPDTLGLELAGVVEAGGAADSPGCVHKPGDRVMCLVGGGAYAEYCLVDEQLAVPVPLDMSLADAACVVEAFFTANETCFVLGGAAKGKRVFVYAGASGVGSTVVQMCKAEGIDVFFTASSDEKIAVVEKLGGKGINRRKVDAMEELKRLTNGEGVDVIVDLVGGDQLNAKLDALRPCGVLVVVGTLAGTATPLNLLHVLKKRLQIKGSVMRAVPLADKIAIRDRFVTRWLPLLADGRIRPMLYKVWPASEVVAAHEAMESNANMGNMVLQFGEEPAAPDSFAL